MDEAPNAMAAEIANDRGTAMWVDSVTCGNAGYGVGNTSQEQRPIKSYDERFITPLDHRIRLVDGMRHAAQNNGARLDDSLQLADGRQDCKQNRIATQHGFRSTFRYWAAEVELFPSDIIEHALAHKLKDEAESAYPRGDLLLKRTYVIERWAHVMTPAPGRAALSAVRPS